MRHPLLTDSHWLPWLLWRNPILNRHYYAMRNGLPLCHPYILDTASTDSCHVHPIKYNQINQNTRVAEWMCAQYITCSDARAALKHSQGPCVWGISLNAAPALSRHSLGDLCWTPPCSQTALFPSQLCALLVEWVFCLRDGRGAKKQCSAASQHLSSFTAGLQGASML